LKKMDVRKESPMRDLAFLYEVKPSWKDFLR